jgi:hypothetical protein
VTGAARLLVLVALVLGGCTTRDRSNPLDPRNSQSQGSLVGFNAIGGDHIVEFRWQPLLVQGVLGYRVQRWAPGGIPRNLGVRYHFDASAGEDSSVTNDSTYVYRLVADLDSGDSAMSAPDTTTPGIRRIFALAAGVPSFLRLSPDGRDVLYELTAHESYLDMEVDRKSGLLWLSAEAAGVVIRKTPEGATVGAVIETGAPGDLSVSSNRGIGWVVSLTDQSVYSYGPDINNPAPQRTITGIASPRVVEAGSTDLSIWVGNEGGAVFRFRAQDLVQTDQWTLGAGLIRAIALDETAGAAWVATRAGDVGNLYYLNPADTSATLVRSGLLNAADLAVDPVSGDVWISERGLPGQGDGRLSLVTRSGTLLASLAGIEPYGIDVDPVDGSCWVSDLRSERILHVDRSGRIVRVSPVLQTPYAVRVTLP